MMIFYRIYDIKNKKIIDLKMSTNCLMEKGTNRQKKYIIFEIVSRKILTFQRYAKIKH